MSDDRHVLVTGASSGIDPATVLLDVTEPEAEGVMAELGPLHGLVDNAGYGLTGAIEDVPDDDEARAVIETMVLAPMRLSRLAIPGMRDAGGDAS